MKKIGDSYHLMGLELLSGSLNSLLITLVELVKVGKTPFVVFTPNPEQIVQAHQNPEFLEVLRQGDLLIPDGVGLVWAARVLGSSQVKTTSGETLLKQRIPGIDVVQGLLREAQAAQWPVVVIGGREYTRLPERVTWIPGYEEIQNPTSLEEKEVTKQLSSIRPKIVFVALGAPWQEQWILDHLELLSSSGVKIAMVVGGAFDVITGKVPRAPRVLRQLGLEWAYRLWREPWRWRRQLRLVLFIWLVIKTRLGL